MPVCWVYQYFNVLPAKDTPCTNSNDENQQLDQLRQQNRYVDVLRYNLMFKDLDKAKEQALKIKKQKKLLKPGTKSKPQLSSEEELQALELMASMGMFGSTLNQNSKKVDYTYSNPMTFSSLLQMPSSGKQMSGKIPSPNPLYPQAFYADSQKPCQPSVPLNMLRQISIPDLSQFLVHKGCYLKLRFIKDSYQMVAIQGRVEDHLGYEVDISIYNFDTKGESCTRIFAKGTVIYVKEPYFKIAMAGNENIRIENPLDIQFESNRYLSEEEKCRLEGIDLMKKEKYVEAYLLYHDAIGKVSSEKEINKLILNKAIVCSHLNLLHDYYDHAEMVIDFDPSNLKATYHKFKALVLLEKYKKASKMLEEYKDQFEQGLVKEMEQFLEKVRKTRENKIDWYQAFKTQNIVGDFFSPKIKIGKSPNGYGVVAEEDIAPGEVLIIEKPFLYFADQGPVNQNLFVINKQSNAMGEYCERLYAISKNFRIKFNSFAGEKELSTNSRTQHRTEEPNLQTRTPKEIAQFINKNSFDLNNFSQYFKKTNHHKGSGLFQKISMINHSCEENVDRFCLGNSMVIFSTRQIKKGAEVFTAYMRSWDVDQRKGSLAYWNISCKCEFCTAQLFQKNNMKPCLDEKSREYKRMKLIQLLKKLKKFDKAQFVQLMEYYDFFTLSFCLTQLGGDMAMASEMFRRVFPMTEAQSVQILTKFLKQ